MFEKGDFVKVKDGIEYFEDIYTSGWAGRVRDYNPEEDVYVIEFDMPTLRAFDDDYIVEQFLIGYLPIFGFFDSEDLIKSERRDTEEELKAEQESFMTHANKLVESMETMMSEFKVKHGFDFTQLTAGDGDELTVEVETEYYVDDEEYEEDAYDRLKSLWIEEFTASRFYQELDEVQQADSEFIIDSFMSYMLQYSGVTPPDWTTKDVEEVLLDYVPRKVSSNIELFQMYGDVIIKFLNFLDAENLIQQAGSLAIEVEKIKHQIPVLASDPRNWGSAKIIAMAAIDQGIDFSNKQEVDRFVTNYNNNLRSNKLMSNPKRLSPPPADLYRDIGRNDKISVQYLDGTKLEGIKFKKVEKDLRSGKCMMI